MTYEALSEVKTEDYTPPLVEQRITIGEAVPLTSGNCGAKKVRSAIDIKMAIKAVPHEGRQTLRSTAALSGIPKTAILRHMKEPHGLTARTR
ncbi:hypothetical protein H257_17456 [Aphanomyces astaci]|uniref:Uncharacterized protein n=1 Tax=Aphanomyces astaci TaxID=112090 RepID=W4FGU0_APHAT|nr:hypothetical protein H257_17456 [Aphanomyces astaci]ETV65978.1 hypothetical protein H257_17456 [Aphanomyces astaci]|eukprot:XP_009844557.1 hypothetical protein H257_17456 [Aphanomyces astaci]